MFSQDLFHYISTILNCYVLEKVTKIHFLISTNQGPKFKGWVVAHSMMIMKPTKCGVNMMSHWVIKLDGNFLLTKNEGTAIFGQFLAGFIISQGKHK
jgi:hypothetical protein